MGWFSQYECLVVYILIETVDLLFRLREHDYHYDHIDYVVHTSVEGLDEDLMALYLGYRDWE
jgi:hypothetical protein